MVRSWVSPKAVKGRPSGIDGRGLFAVEPIHAGEVVAVKGGHVVDAPTLAALPPKLRESDVQIADALYLAALTEDEYEDVMLFINHSCGPNVGFAGNIVLVAMRDIENGEELTTDYAFFDPSGVRMECRCGHPSCRRVVSGDDWRRPDLQERYGEYFATFLQRRFRRPDPGSR